MIARFMVVALCVLGSLTCVAHGGNINGEATYISFSVPGSLGTYPMSINSSMTVTGYYYVSPTVSHGFLREADGTITTFDVVGAVWIEPEGINAAGNITGFYELTAGIPQGFLRYADGRMVTFDPIPTQKEFPPEAQPVVSMISMRLLGIIHFHWQLHRFLCAHVGVPSTLSRPPSVAPTTTRWRELSMQATPS
jgi:hypothetical protein